MVKRITAIAIALLLGVLVADGSGRAHEPTSVDLSPGANLISFDGADQYAASATFGLDDDIVAIWAFDAPTQAWSVWGPGLPAFARGFDRLEQGRAYFVIASTPVTWHFSGDPVDGSQTPVPNDETDACLPGADLSSADFLLFFHTEPVGFTAEDGWTGICAAPRASGPGDPVQQAVAALLDDGPTGEESAAGALSFWNMLPQGESDCGGEDFLLEVVNGTATVRFCRTVLGVGALADGLLLEELGRTLRQFDGVDRAVILNESGAPLFGRR